MTWRLALAACLLTTAAACAGETFPFRGRHPFWRGPVGAGEVSPELKETRLAAGRGYVADYLFACTAGPLRLFNFNFESMAPSPGKLAVFDGDKKYLGWVAGGSVRLFFASPPSSGTESREDFLAGGEKAPWEIARSNAVEVGIVSP